MREYDNILEELEQKSLDLLYELKNIKYQNNDLSIFISQEQFNILYKLIIDTRKGIIMSIDENKDYSDLPKYKLMLINGVCHTIYITEGNRHFIIIPRIKD